LQGSESTVRKLVALLQQEDEIAKAIDAGKRKLGGIDRQIMCVVLLLLAPELALPRTLKRCTISRRVLADTSILCQVVEYCGGFSPVYACIPMNSIEF
jgi:hypothetical protein